jgi:hypothetical protein
VTYHERFTTDISSVFHSFKDIITKEGTQLLVIKVNYNKTLIKYIAVTVRHDTTLCEKVSQ